MQTQCPDCKTRFHVNGDQLRVAQGQVRCSRCHIIFNALEFLQPPAADMPATATKPEKEESTSDTDLMSDLGLDEFSDLKAQITDDLCPFEEGEPTTPPDTPVNHINDDLSDVLRELEEFELDAQQKAQVTPQQQMPKPDAPATQETAPPPQASTDPEQPDSRQDTTPRLQDQLLIEDILGKTKPKKKSGGLWWSVGILTLLLLALSQLSWFGRDKLMRYPEGRMLLQSTCQYLGCKLPTIRSPEQIQVLSRSISSHPKVENALLIQLTIANKANFPQPQPMLQISLFSSEEQLVVQRRFQPNEYLSDNSQHGQLDPGKAMYVELEIQDPGSDVTGFKLEFF